MDDNRKQELAFLYLHGELPAEEKPLVFELILQDEDFRRCLKEELTLREQWAHLRHTVPDHLYQSVLNDIRAEQVRLAQAAQRTADEAAHDEIPPADVQEPAWLAVSEKLLSLMMPSLIYPMIKHLQRRCLT